MVPETPNGPFNPGDKPRVAQCGYPVSGNCLHMWACQFLPRFHQDTVLLPAFGGTQRWDHTAQQCWGQANPLSPIHPVTAGSARSGWCSNYPPPRPGRLSPVPGWGWMFSP